jgi:transposase-like protein
MSRRRFTKEFKTAAAKRLLRGESGSEVARELDVKRAKLYEWASQLERYGDDAFPGPGRRPGGQQRVERGREDEARVAALERKIGQQAVEIDFLQQALRRVEDLRHETLVSGGGGSANLSDPPSGKAS